MQLAHAGGGVIVFGLRELALDRDQLAVACEHVLERGRGARRGFLSDPRHGQTRLDFDIARLGVQLIAQQRKQTALAAAIRPGDADLLTRKQRDARAFEESFGAALESDVTQRDHR